MRRSLSLTFVVAIGLLGVLSGCSKKDDTMTAAPPPGTNARALPNTSGTKRMMGAAGGGRTQAPPIPSKRRSE